MCAYIYFFVKKYLREPPSMWKRARPSLLPIIVGRVGLMGNSEPLSKDTAVTLKETYLAAYLLTQGFVDTDTAARTELFFSVVAPSV